MTRDRLIGCWLGLLCAGAYQVASAEDMTINRLLASQCAQCHGTNGHAVGDMDGLHDESAADLYEDLMDMRSEDRPGDIMDHQALGYTEDQIRRIASYFGMRAGTDGMAPMPDGTDSDHSEESGTREPESDGRRDRKRRDD